MCEYGQPLIGLGLELRLASKKERVNGYFTFFRWIEFTCTINKATSSIGIYAHSLEVSDVLIDGCVASHTQRLPTINSIPDCWKNGGPKDAAQKTAKLVYMQHKHLLDFQKQPNIVVEVPDTPSTDDQQASTSDRFRDIVVQVAQVYWMQMLEVHLALFS